MSGVKSIESLRRGLEVIRALKSSSAASLGELHRHTRLPKATLLRILRTLQEEGWIERHEVEHRYVLRSEAGDSYAPDDWRAQFSAIAGPFRAALQRQTLWPIEIAVRYGTSMLILNPRQHMNGLAANYRALGIRPLMLISSLGRCYLAFCSDEERNEILGELSRSTQLINRVASQPEAVRRFISDAQRLGYAKRDASEVEGDSPERFEAIAVPIFCNGRIVATLACAWLYGIVNEREIVAAHLKRLQNTASAIQNQLQASRFEFETLR
ncbi:helix-turn-helix domain-containing protein [Pusillimonas noertemannii]|uniref:IclR family transcriptional regulator n=1 Tax=Pusillimonas noertemannii TaxID=305977 RepID=A0A2U1CPR0_9BURK|nr:helix-turn-helix domain-containing protein [Pusillimonas noertemannii]NYT67149.1 helix-turn-helix domain-containing protein [Pusillimonas noertemannii]PVY67824.1 IclR family transcriptional regulator [Pusillimonas noertemannii]TFL12649.1 IclR family transcriptional regulator [Pusillimonas noertemannii]